MSFRCASYTVNGPRCRNNASKGRATCAVHRGLLHLFVAQSSLPNAGLGLYTSASIEKGTVISNYTGQILNKKEREQNNSDYILQVSDDCYIDAEQSTSLCRFINDGMGPLNNAEIVVFESEPNSAYAVAIRYIAPGSEILASYGSEYWNAKSVLI